LKHGGIIFQRFGDPRTDEGRRRPHVALSIYLFRRGSLDPRTDEGRRRPCCSEHLGEAPSSARKFIASSALLQGLETAERHSLAPFCYREHASPLDTFGADFARPADEWKFFCGREARLRRAFDKRGDAFSPFDDLHGNVSNFIRCKALPRH
jgi:hypothetical protein